MWFLLRKKWFWLTLIILFLGNVIWPVRSLISAKFLFNEHLLVLTNEAELRPCGGFVTAYGKVRILPPKVELKNVYALKNAEFGKAPDPINQVSDKLKFWDLGTNPDLNKCVETFQNSAKNIDLGTDDVILLDISTVEEITDDKDLFPNLTRSVANTDRHDEESLKERKSPLVSFGRKTILDIIIRPWKWAEISREISSKIDNGNIFISQISPEIKPLKNDFSFYEWNLGGGKSSRFLDKKITIYAREDFPGEWSISGEFFVEHSGHYDEPLSQEWKGQFEFNFPQVFNQKSLKFPAKLSPGEKWEERFEFNYNGELSELSFFNQRGQKIFLDLKVSLFGQQKFGDANFDNHENVGYIYKESRKFREIMKWDVLYDQVRPFVTMHQWSGNRESIPDKYRKKWSDFFKISSRKFSFAEIHFSEPVFLTEKTKVEVSDKDFENKQISENPVFEDIILFDDKITALVGFWQNEVQEDERFFLEFRGILDSFGNEISDNKYTIIDRISNKN